MSKRTNAIIGNWSLHESKVALFYPFSAREIVFNLFDSLKFFQPQSISAIFYIGGLQIFVRFRAVLYKQFTLLHRVCPLNT